MSKPRGARSRAPRARRTCEIAPNSVYPKGILDASDETSFGPGRLRRRDPVSHREGRDFARGARQRRRDERRHSGSVTVGGQSVVVEERTVANQAPPHSKSNPALRRPPSP